jgi:hypothetical protein
MPISLPLSGSCRCGRVTMEISAPPLMTAACHCRGCQRMASSAYSLTAMVPVEGFAVTEGETVVGGMHGEQLEHNFCAWCMSWMFTRIAGQDFVNVRPTFFDDVGWFRPYIETWTATKLPFAETGAVESFVEFPPMEEFGALMERYRAWAG